MSKREDEREQSKQKEQWRGKASGCRVAWNR